MSENPTSPIDPQQAAITLANASRENGALVYMQLGIPSDTETTHALVLATADPGMAGLLETFAQRAMLLTGMLDTWPARPNLTAALAEQLAQAERQAQGILQPGDPGFSVPGGVL